MTDRRATAPWDQAVERIRSATLSLIQAARSGEPDAVLEAMEQRGCAVERLREAFEAPAGQEPDPRIRAELLESLSLQAQEAEAELRGLQNHARDTLRALSEGARAMRGYAGSRPDPRALDRSG
jgi:hypothetical protein